MMKSLPQPPKHARTTRDPGAPPVQGFWTVESFTRLIYGHWDGIADGLLRQAGSDKCVDDLPPELIQKLRSKSADDAVKHGLRLLNEQGRLLTTRQFADLKSGRVLRPGDLVRYIGPRRTERIDRASDGAMTTVIRPHGQLGYISIDREKRTTPDSRRLLVFVPQIDPQSAEPRRMVDARLVFAPWRGDYWKFARVLPQEVAGSSR